MIHQSIQPYLPKVIELFRKHKITSAYVFGSVLTDKFNDQSDVDFLVNIQEGLDPVETGGHLWDLTYELEDLLNRHVDLLTERSLKNHYFIKQVNETKIAIYG
jgi:predicted nucleotidyltransferase